MADNAKPTRSGKKKRRGLIFFIILIVLLGLAALAILSGGKGEGVEVETGKVQRRSIIETVVATGHIEPRTQVVISSEVSGEIVFLGVEEGEAVEKGEVLVKINPESMLAQLDEAKAQIAAAKARKASSEASSLRAEQEFKRVTELFNRKLATAQELETAESQMKVAQAEVEAAGYSVEQAEATYRRMQESVAKTTIRAPMSGVVTKLNSKLGEKVVGAIQMTGTEIMTIADLGIIEAVVDVVETDVVQVDVGDTADVEVDAIPDETFRAVVSQIANSPTQVGEGTQEQLTNFEVRLRFISPDKRFRPGMTAAATIMTERQNNVLSLPIQAVTTRVQKRGPGGGGPGGEGPSDRNVRDLSMERGKVEEAPQPVVFVLEKDSVVMRKVETGIRDDRYIQITEGLTEDQTVVVGSYRVVSQELEDGMKVRVQSAADRKNGWKQ